MMSGPFASPKAKKADVGKHPEVFGHVGLLVNRPPGTAGLPFIKSTDNFGQAFGGAIRVQ
jgi:hypothetical protein